MSFRSHAIAAMLGAFVASGGFALAAATANSGAEDVDALHARIDELEAEVAKLKGEPTPAEKAKCAADEQQGLVIPTKSVATEDTFPTLNPQ